MENKISLEYIINKIMLDLDKGKIITNSEIEVIITPYTHMKNYLSFKLNEGSKEPLVITEKITDFTFYIYDDFYNDRKYDKYHHIMINLPNSSGKFRVDYYYKTKKF